MADERDIAAYYDRGEEEGRLGDWGRLEFLRTRELLARSCPPRPPPCSTSAARPAPLRAAAGPPEGYEVHLVDPVALHVEQAGRGRAQPDAPFASAVVGDARELPDETTAQTPSSCSARSTT